MIAAMITVPNNIPIRIKGTLYKQDVKYTNFKKGDLVLDIGDMTYGTIDYVFNSDGANTRPLAALRDGWVTEVGISFDRLIKLTPMSRLQLLIWKIRKALNLKLPNYK